MRRTRETCGHFREHWPRSLRKSMPWFYALEVTQVYCLSLNRDRIVIVPYRQLLQMQRWYLRFPFIGGLRLQMAFLFVKFMKIGLKMVKVICKKYFFSWRLFRSPYSLPSLQLLLYFNLAYLYQMKHHSQEEEAGVADHSEFLTDFHLCEAQLFLADPNLIIRIRLL